MNYIELSIKDLENQCKDLHAIISKEYIPDSVVFIAKGSFIIGDEISKHFNVPLIACYAERKGNKFKKVLSPFLKIIPKDIKKTLRKKELELGLHKKSTSRNVYIENKKDILQNSKNILLVDDSVDTGNTVKEVFTFLKDEFDIVNIRVATINYFEESEEVFKVDYSLLKNHMINGPWSKDSKYYKEFKQKYNLAKEKGVF